MFLKLSNDRRKILYGVMVIAFIKVLLSLLWYDRYGLFGDEYIYIASGKRLSMGYMDHPPIVPFLATIASAIQHNSFFVLRFIAALAGGCTVILLAAFTFLIGGTRRAVILSALLYLSTPVFLRGHTKFVIEIFEHLGILMFFCVLACFLKYRKPWLLIALWVVAAIAFLIKYSMLFWLAMFFVCIICFKDYRGLWKNKCFFLGAVYFLLLITPNIWWQYTYNFPILRLFERINSLLSESMTYFSFVLGQIVYIHPFGVVIALCGLVYFVSCKSKGYSYRIFAYMSVGVFLFLFFQKAKVYYTSAVFLPLISGGAIYIDQLLVSQIKKQIAYIALGIMFFSSVFLALPVIPFELHIKLTEYFFPDNIVPLKYIANDYKDRKFWEGIVVDVSNVYQQLTEEEKKETYIFCSYYTVAAALEYYLEKYNLPPVISAHNDYILWYDGRCKGNNIISVGWSKKHLQDTYEVIEEVPQTQNRFFNNPEIYLCKNRKKEFNVLFKKLSYVN